MTARAHPTPSPQRRAATGVDARLPWWALALPTLAFTVLLVLVVGGGEADAAAGQARQSAVHTLLDVLGRFVQAFLG